MPSLLYRTMIFLLLTSSIAMAVRADSNLDAGIDIQFERAHQEFSNASADVNAVDIAPHLQYGNWDFSLDVPWISADANYVNSNFPARLVTACGDPRTAVSNRLPNLSSRRTAKIAAKLAAYCDSVGVLSPDDTVSGLSDITAFARYGVLLDEQGIWLLSFGAGYKFDNGDADKNLGGSTRNTLLETSLGAAYGKWSGAVTAGYAFVNGGDELTTQSHYAYSSFDIGFSPLAWATLGCTVDYDQSYVVTADDAIKVTAYIRVKPGRHLRLKIYARDFGDTEGYPEREYGGSLAFVY